MGRPRKTPQAGGSVPLYAARIKEARERLGWSQAKLGEEIGRSQNAITDWETGDAMPRPSVWGRLEEVLGVPAAVFTGGAETNDSRELSYRREIFGRLFEGLRRIVAEFGMTVAPADFSFVVYNLWVEVLLRNHPPTLAERVDAVLREQREGWQRQRKAGNQLIGIDHFVHHSGHAAST